VNYLLLDKENHFVENENRFSETSDLSAS